MLSATDHEFMASLRTLARMQLAESSAPTLEWD